VERWKTSEFKGMGFAVNVSLIAAYHHMTRPHCLPHVPTPRRHQTSLPLFHNTRLGANFDPNFPPNSHHDLLNLPPPNTTPDLSTSPPTPPRALIHRLRNFLLHGILDPDSIPTSFNSTSIAGLILEFLSLYHNSGLGRVRSLECIYGIPWMERWEYG
jgi:hypothetical protein